MAHATQFSSAASAWCGLCRGAVRPLSYIQAGMYNTFVRRITESSARNSAQPAQQRSAMQLPCGALYRGAVFSDYGGP